MWSKRRMITFLDHKPEELICCTAAYSSLWLANFQFVSPPMWTEREKLNHTPFLDLQLRVRSERRPKSTVLSLRCWTVWVLGIRLINIRPPVHTHLGVLTHFIALWFRKTFWNNLSTHYTSINTYWPVRSLKKNRNGSTTMAQHKGSGRMCGLTIRFSYFWLLHCCEVNKTQENAMWRLWSLV